MPEQDLSRRPDPRQVCGCAADLRPHGRQVGANTWLSSLDRLAEGDVLDDHAIEGCLQHATVEAASPAVSPMAASFSVQATALAQCLLCLQVVPAPRRRSSAPHNAFLPAPGRPGEVHALWAASSAHCAARESAGCQHLPFPGSMQVGRDARPPPPPGNDVGGSVLASGSLREAAAARSDPGFRSRPARRRCRRRSAAEHDSGPPLGLHRGWGVTCPASLMECASTCVPPTAIPAIETAGHTPPRRVRMSEPRRSCLRPMWSVMFSHGPAVNPSFIQKCDPPAGDRILGRGGNGCRPGAEVSSACLKQRPLGIR